MALISLWQDRHPRTPAVPVPPSGTWDVAVVGAGLAGLTTALLLARAGRSVVVLEADHVGVGTTGRSTAKVSLLQGTHLTRIARRHRAEVVTSYVEANAEGQAWLRRFCDEHEVGHQLRPAYTFGFSARGERAARTELKHAEKAGLPVTWVERPDLPFATRGALRLDDQFQLDPCELLDALSLEAAAHGVHLVEGARVRRVTGRSPARVVTDLGEVEAATVVLATGTPILDRGGFFARTNPSRSYTVAFRTPYPAVDGMYLSADAPSRSLRDAPGPGSSSLLLVGGAGHITGRARSESDHLDELRAWTAANFTGAEETHAWSAQDYVTHHALPYAGPLLPGEDHLLVAGGFSKWGMTNAVAAALALSSRILGGSTPWAGVMAPWGARELPGLLDAARSNGEVGVHLAGGWLRPVLGTVLDLVPGRNATDGHDPAEDDGTVRLDRLGPPGAVSHVDGVRRRVSGVCSHLGGVVAWNDAERSWDCPLHGSRFGPSGQVLEGPATCGLGHLLRGPVEETQPTER